MLTCIARPKKLGDDSLSHPDDPNSSTAKNQSVKSLTTQVTEKKPQNAYLSLASPRVVIYTLHRARFFFFSVEGHGVEGVGGVQELQPVRGAESTQEPRRSGHRRRRLGRRLGSVPVVVPENRQFKLDDDEDVGEGNGSKAERNFKRRGNAELRQWPPCRAGGAVRRGERTERMGSAGGAGCFNYVCFASAWRE